MITWAALAALANHPRDDLRLDRRHYPGRTPARRLPRITHITEVMGMEGDTIITQDIFLYDLVAKTPTARSSAATVPPASGRPRFWDAPAISTRRSGLPRPSMRRSQLEA